MGSIYEEYDGRTAMRYDAVPKVRELLQRGYVLNEEGFLEQGLKSRSMDAPWVYVRHHPEHHCQFWHEILFKVFEIFPRQCLKCWKVVVRPRTVEELIMLLEMEINHTNRPCKCGVEKRSYVPANYGGYFYCRSEEEGYECLEDVRGLVAKHISPDVPVILKRQCTEFELKFGPSDQIEDTLLRGYYVDPEQGKVPVMKIGEMQIWQAIAEKIIKLERSLSPQAEFVKQHIISEWFQFAWDRGDMTVKKFFGGENMYTPSVTYAR